MTNIYNKKVLVENGTLINNWFEEEILKKLTGQTRNIPGIHIKKQRKENELQIMDTSSIQSDNTKMRTMRVEKIEPYTTTYNTYGDFKIESGHFNKVGPREKIFQSQVENFLYNERIDKNSHENEVNCSRINESTYKSNFIQQPQVSELGQRHMKSQDGIPVDYTKTDKYFMATHDMGKFQRVIPEDKAHNYIDSSIPYFNDKAITFWSQNADKSNMFRSHMKGENSFARSSGFTQLVGQTKAANQYHGNVSNSKESKYVYVNPDSNYQFNKISKEQVDLSKSVREKFLQIMYKKGWLAIRKYKMFLFNLSKRKSTVITKNDFKYYSTNFGIYFTDEDIDFIYSKFDINKSNKICYENFIENLIKV